MTFTIRSALAYDLALLLFRPRNAVEETHPPCIGGSPTVLALALAYYQRHALNLMRNDT